MKRALVFVLLFAAHLAYAAPHTVLVLRSEGTADTASRTNIDTHVLRLARNIDGKVEAGDITLTEAAAAVGCNPSDASCKDEVLTTLGVDEMVASTVTATPSGTNVTVRRITRGGAPRAAQTTIPAGKQPDAKINTDIGPLFGVGMATAPLTDKPPANEAKETAQHAKPEPEPAKPAPAQPAPKAEPQNVAAADTSEPDKTVTAAPSGSVQPAEGRPSRRLQKIGMGIGGGFVLLGLIMWSQASDVDNQIEALPEPRTPGDFKELRDLESTGDSYAGAGNLFFLVGVGIGATSAYFYWRAGRSGSTQTARLTPTVFPNGAGVALTWGGAR
jgi:hypothetical protein